MLVAAVMTDVLFDGKGLPCLNCRDKDGNSTGVIGEGEDAHDCPECGGDARIYEGDRSVGLAKDDVLYLDDLLQYQDTVRLISASRDRPLTPTEWLSQPAKYTAAYRVLVPHLSSFDGRTNEKKAPDG